MISLEDQESLLQNIARRLKKKITVYCVGGTAMMFLGLKEATLDIDLVFNNEDDKKIFIQSAKELGYKEINPIIVYGTKENSPEMLTLGDERFDLFVNEVIDFIFSENMKKRAERELDFEGKLILKVANHNDIIIMKCATDRIKDKDDAKRIIETKKIEWNLIIEEIKNQVKLGKETAYMNLGSFLENLKYKIKVDIPKKVLDDIYALLDKQVKEKKVILKNKK